MGRLSRLADSRVGIRDEMSDSAGDDSRFAGAGTGEDQQRALDVQDRFALFRVERF